MDHDHRAADLDGLRERAVPGLLALLGGSAAVAAWASLPGTEFRLGPFVVLVSALVVCGAAWWAARRGWALAVAALVLGSYGVAGAASLWSSELAVVTVLTLSIAASACLFVPWAPVAVSVGAVVCHVALQTAGLQTTGLGATVALYILTGGSLAIALRASHQTLSWSWERHEEARGLAEQLRDRQGELNQTVKALDLAYRLLQRTNHELAIAREEAEDARHLKEQFAANISHELRTPLNLILGFSEMMYLSPEVYGDMEWSSSLRRDVAQVFTASRHLAQLVDDVLDLSRLNAERMPLRLETCDVNRLLSEVARTATDLARSKPIEIELDLAPELPTVSLDCTRMRQVFLNLVNNAIRFTSEGVVKISTRLDPAGLLASVEDTGVGIPEDELERIFDEFHQASADDGQFGGGIGLGLAISRRFVQLHGGRLWAESDLGVGSRFHVLLPVDGTRTRVSRLRMSGPVPTPANPYADSVLVLGGGADAVSLLERHIGGHQVIDARYGDLHGHVEQYHPRAGVVPLSLAATRRTLYALQTSALSSGLPLLFATVPNTAWRAEMLGVQACLQKPVRAEDLLRELDRIGDAREVLLVDDDRGFVQMVARMLQTSPVPYSVSWAYSAREGLDSMQRSRPDVVVLDLLMPGEDGRAVLAAMRADPALHDVPVILVTAMDIDEDLGGPVTGFVGMVHREPWGVADTLKALGALLELTRPRYSTAAEATPEPPVVGAG